eukprot:gene14204-20174_t
MRSTTTKDVSSSPGGSSVVGHTLPGREALSIWAWHSGQDFLSNQTSIAPNTTPSAESYSTTTRTVMGALHITLMWMLQSVDISEAGGLSSIHALADHVLTAIASHKEDCNTEHGPNSTQPSPPVWVDQHVATALIDGNVTLDPVVLHNTPPELLVLLLRQCAPANSSSSTQPLSPHDSGGGDVNGAGAGPQQGYPDAFAKYGLAPIMKGQLLASEDVRERYLGGVYLLNHWMLNQQDKYWRTLRQLVSQAQQVDDERLIQNPYLQICTMLSVDHA